MDQLTGRVFAIEGVPGRHLRTFRIQEGLTSNTGDEAAKVGAILDVETTGRDIETDNIIELAIRRFRFNDAGEVTAIGRCYSWFQDPGVPLAPEIIDLTGLTDDDVRGQEIDTRAAASVMAGIKSARAALST